MNRKLLCQLLPRGVRPPSVHSQSNCSSGQEAEDTPRSIHLQNEIALNLDSAIRCSLPKLNSNECAPAGTFPRKVTLETCNLESAFRCSEQRTTQPLYLFNRDPTMPRGARIRKLELMRVTSENDCQQPLSTAGLQPRIGLARALTKSVNN